MGDSVNLVADPSDVDMSKIEPERTPSSIESTPERDTGAEPAGDNVPPQKRKGGRKPIYATSEERKQRNRQAQAAFRERRTEYIKQLEATIKQNEDSLASLQQSHRSAADECLMLRYKNSLLERILLEKGVDVQAELQMKTGTPTLPPGFMPPGMGSSHAQPPLQRAAVQRQHARRSAQVMTPKPQQVTSPQDMTYRVASPQAGPTPTSRVSSPSTHSTRSPVIMQPGAMTPPTSGGLAQSQQQQQQFPTFSKPQPQHDHAYFQAQQQQSNTYRAPTQRAVPPQQYHSSASNASNQSASSHPSTHPAPQSASTSGGSAPGSAPNSASYYPKQEYDTQDASHSMLDQLDPDTNDRSLDPGLHGAYPSQRQYAQHFAYQPQQQLQLQAPLQPQQGQNQILPMGQTAFPTEGDAGGGAYGDMAQLIDPDDPMLDADPFGLSASMHYPTSYSFEPHPQR